MSNRAANAGTRVPFLVADSFVLALDGFMRRTRQGGHVSHSIVELDRAPDLPRLRTALARVLAKYPLLTARPRRHWRTRLPYWDVPPPPCCELPLGLWRQTDGNEDDLPGASCVGGIWPLIQSLSAGSPDAGAVRFNARVDVLARGTGAFCVILTWSHLLLDGKGAELFLAELGRLCDGTDVPDDDDFLAPAAKLSLVDKFRLTRAAMNHQTALQKTGVPSLGGPKPRQGVQHYQIVTLSAQETAAVSGRLEGVGSTLFPLTFYVACVARAHDRVFRHRKIAPAGYGISVPTQTRKRGTRGPLFRNHVAALLFHPQREHLGSLEETAKAMKQQFATMVRTKVGESFEHVLDLMRPLPSRLFVWIVRAQFRGEFCTCYHSYTGSFAPEMTEFAGAPIANAYHLPCLGTPPGTGIFFGEHGGRLNVTVSWREGAMTDQERQLMIDQLREDLLGAVPAA